MLTLAYSEFLTPILGKVGWGGPPVEALMESYDLTAEAAIGLSSPFISLMRQSDANLRMPQSPQERGQTLATPSGLTAGAMKLWWDYSKARFAEDFVAELGALTVRRAPATPTESRPVGR